MGISRITLLLSLGSGLLASDSMSELLEAPRPKAEASATVTVTAESAPVAVDKTPNPVKVMDAQAIQDSGARSLDTILPELLPGQLQPYGGPGTLANLYLGGGRGQDVVIVLDGIRITDSSSPNPSFSDFSLAGIGRVEVLQGPASTRYGSDTHGGVVNLSSTGSAPEGFSGNATLGNGNRDLWLAKVSNAYGWNGGWAKLSLSADQEEQSIPANSPFQSAAGAFNVGQVLGENGLLTFTYRDHYRGTPLPFAAGYDANWNSQRIFAPGQENSEHDEDIITSYRQTLGDAWLLEASFGHVNSDRVEPGMNVSDPSDHFSSQRNQGVASLTWTPSKSFHSELLLDLNGDNADLKSEHATGTHRAAALELNWEWAFGLRAVVSGRYQKDQIETDAPSVDDPSKREALPERDSQRLVYKGGLNWLSQSGLRFYASYGTSYNAPQLSQLTWNLSRDSKDHLENETSHSLQLGTSLERGPWNARLEASRTQYDQILAWLDLGNWDGKYINGTNLRVQGLEASLAYARTGWRLEGFARSQEARNESQPKTLQLSSSGATGRPFFSGGLRGEATLGEWRLQARWSYVGSSYQYFDDFSAVAGAHTHFNDAALALTWSPLKSWGFTLRGEHLMQRTWTKEEWQAGALLRKNDAYLVPTFPAPGPTVSLEITYRF